MESSNSRRRYAFGDFQLDRDQLMLYRGETEIPLPPKAVETLIALILRQGEIVSKDDLMNTIWSDTVVEESNLSRYIHVLRSTLGKKNDGKQYIETFRRRGYRFNADVEVVRSGSAVVSSVRDFPQSTVGGGAVREATTGNVIAVAEWQRPALGAIEEPTTEKRVRRTALTRKTVAWIALAIVLAGISLGVYLIGKFSGPPLSDRDVILIADFDNRTGDDVFDEALRQGLQFQLQQSPYLSLLPDDRTQQTLKLMRRSVEERITRDIAREICQRRGLKAFIVGTIVPVGRHYVLTLQAINAASDEILASELQEADQREQVISALSRAASGLREKLGESLQSIQKLDSPLELTTTSLEALKLHSLAVRAQRRQDFSEAVPLFNRAIELDPSFAFAYTDLANTYQTSGRNDLTNELILKAYELRDRVSELERMLITDSYHSYITADINQRREILLLLRRLYPRDYRVLYRLAALHEFCGEYEQAIDVAKDSIHTGSLLAHAVMIRSYIATYRLDEAKAAVDQAIESGAVLPQINALRAEIAFSAGDTATLDEKIAALPDPTVVKARIAMRLGRFTEARKLLQAAIEKATGRSDTERSAALNAELAFNFASVAGCRDAVPAAEKAAKLSEYMIISSLSALGLAYCREFTIGEQIMDARMKKTPEATVLHTVTEPIFRAVVSNRKGDPANSIEELRNVPDVLSRARWPYQASFIRGSAFLRLNDGASAANEFQQIIDNPGESTFSPLYPLAHLGLARAFVQVGDLGRARESYNRFFEIWKDADSDLAPLVEARREYQRYFGAPKE